MSTVIVNHAHLYCGLGGGAKGMNQGRAQVGNLRAKFQCIGGIDVDAAAIRDFERMAGVSGTVMDLMNREQYIDFHGQEPSANWKEAMPLDICEAFNNEHPHILFLSAPCKGFSGLLSTAKSQSKKYQALNGLTLRGIWLALEAYKDDPIELIIFENVPRIATRGRFLLDQILSLLSAYGYAVAETTHDCGELGGLAQSRKRFLLVARHRERVPSFLYEPVKKSMQSVGSVLSKMPMPGDVSAGPMHRLPKLQWKTWVRLAFIEVGKDWRSLNSLVVENGFLKDYAIVPDKSLQCQPVEDVHTTDTMRNDCLGVVPFDKYMGTVTSRGFPHNGKFSVADPRTGYPDSAHKNIFHVVPWDGLSKTVTTANHVAGGGLSVADPRTNYSVNSHSKIFVVPWQNPARTVIGAQSIIDGALSVADPRIFPAAKDKCTAQIIALDGTWHRPFTTLELAALQGLLDPEEYLKLDGLSDTSWRERIGNAVPPPAAKAIASVMGEVLLLTWSGEVFSMSRQPIWVKPMAAALMAAQ